MRNILSTLLIVVTAHSSLLAQEVLFRVELAPNTKYVTEMNIISNSTMDMEGNEQALEQMRAGGMTLPMNMKAEQTMETSTECGDKKPSGEVPVMIEYTKLDATQSLNGQSMPSQPNPMQGMKLYGIVKDGSKIQVDSIVGVQLADAMKETIKQTVEQMLAGVEFPDTPMKIGDEFTQEIPMSIPIAGVQVINITIYTKYKLKSISNGKAYFDTDQNVKLSGEVEGTNMDASGSGTGISIFDMNEKIMSEQTSDLKMNLNVSVGPMKITTQSDTETSMKINIIR